MKRSARLLTMAWIAFLSGLGYALLVPTGEASVWILLPTTLIGLPLVIHFGYLVFHSPMAVDAEKVVAKMTPVAIKPEPRLPGEMRSELLVVGHYMPGGNLDLYKELVKYRISDGAWLEYKTDKVVDMEITHWIKASEQDKLY